ncbi:hypothetical protein IE4803_CH01373 [Rhizobium etli bv. phaseoli str. IE4803]|nr:hypothetical protein IE4803_CH01373 [Rhizobium etli bv. phaseoli str. IE4803]
MPEIAESRQKREVDAFKLSSADFMMNDQFIFESESFVKFERKPLSSKASDV